MLLTNPALTDFTSTFRLKNLQSLISISTPGHQFLQILSIFQKSIFYWTNVVSFSNPRLQLSWRRRRSRRKYKWSQRFQVRVAHSGIIFVHVDVDGWREHDVVYKSHVNRLAAGRRQRRMLGTRGIMCCQSSAGLQRSHLPACNGSSWFDARWLRDFNENVQSESGDKDWRQNRPNSTWPVRIAISLATCAKSSLFYFETLIYSNRLVSIYSNIF